MKKYLLTSFKIIIFLSLGVFLIWLALKGLTKEDIQHVKDSFAAANYLWVILALCMGVLAHLSRAIRWKMLLAPLNNHPKLSNTFYAVMIGYLGNLAIHRLGEVLRCSILNRYEKVPLNQAFGTVVTERVVDTLLLFILMGYTIWLQYERMHDYITQHIFSPLKLKFAGLIGNRLILLVLIVVILLCIVIVSLLRKKIAKNSIIQKASGILVGFWDGIRSVTKVKSPALFIFHSIFIWIMYFLSLYLCKNAFEETQSLTIADGLALLCFGSLGIIATPGGLGAYQWIVLQIMTLWGYSAAIGVAFGWIVWLAQTALILIFGVASFGLLALNKEAARVNQS